MTREEGSSLLLIVGSPQQGMLAIFQTMSEELSDGLAVRSKPGIFQTVSEKFGRSAKIDRTSSSD